MTRDTPRQSLLRANSEETSSRPRGLHGRRRGAVDAPLAPGGLASEVTEEERRHDERHTSAERRNAARLRLRNLVARGRGPVQPITEARGTEATLIRDRLFRRTLLVADALAVLLAFPLASQITSGSPRLVLVGLIELPALLFGAKLFGLYDRDEVLLHKTTLDEAPRLFNIATLSAMLAWLAGGLIAEGPRLRLTALVLWMGLLAMLVLARAAARSLALRLAPEERCLFIGDESFAETVRAKLSGHGGVRARLVAHLDLDRIAPWSSDDCTGPKLARVRELAGSLDVQRAIIAPGSADAEETLDLVRTLKAVGVKVSVVPRLLEVVGSSVEFDELHGVTVMGVRRFELTRSSERIKRAFDLAMASLMLLAALPLMLLVALAIKLDTRGDVFFRQVRVGRHGRRFHMFKFRTMVQDAEQMKDALRERNEAAEGLFKIADDPRITRVGRILRKTALDELPQLLNILRGEMSVVGPRPLVIEEDQRVIGWYRRRLELTPGMTGHWQILGPARVPLREMAAIDYLYVANWSLWRDVKILLRTIPYVLGRRGM